MVLTMAVHELSATPAGTPLATGAGLAVRSVEVAYGNVVALRGVSVDVGPGAFVSVLGANGAGKTTLVRAITGLLPLHRGRIVAGTITLDGRRIDGLSSRDRVRAGIAQVPEGRKLFARLTVEENLLCGAATRHDRAELRDNLGRVFTLFPRLADRRRQTAGYLSGGEQQMVAVGRALMAQPRFLVCDELSLGLAPIIVGQLFELLNEVRAGGVGVLVIEQNARLAMKHTEHGYVIELGRVVLDGPCRELRDDSVVQDLYLGGGGEEKADFVAAAQRPRRWRR
jgi:branched-chain amino acid transport system ATP-binding protein